MASRFESFLKKASLCTGLRGFIESQFQPVTLSLFLTFVAAISASGQQLVQNGGFESGSFSSWIQSGNTGSTSAAANPLYTYSGTYGAQLGPSGSLGFLSQTLTTTPGQTYLLSLWLDSPNGSSPNAFQVSWNGTNVFNQTNIAAIGWTNLQFTVVATTASTSLQFGFQDNPSYLGLDDISVVNIATGGNSAAYTWTTLAGVAARGNVDGVGSDAQFNNPHGVALDKLNNLYVVDSANQTVRKITPAGLVTTIAGFPGSVGSTDGTGGAARFRGPSSIALDTNGNLYVSDQANNTIRKITPVGTNWVVTTIAGLSQIDGQGNAVAGNADGVGSAARFNRPYGLAISTNGSLYVSDSANQTIRKLTPSGTNWMVSTFAGLATNTGSADGVGSIARFRYPYGLAADTNGNLYVTDNDNSTIRKITPAGSVTTLAGLAFNSGSTDGTGSNARFGDPDGIAIDSAGNLYVADSGANNNIRKITPAGVVTTFAGLALTSGYLDAVGTAARFFGPSGLAVDSAGNVYVVEYQNSTIRKITSAGAVSTLAGVPPTGSSGSANGTGDAARFYGPSGVAVDTNGNVFVADANNNLIRKITAAGFVSTIAGQTNSGSLDGVSINARFNFPSGVAVDTNGNVYVADSFNFTIRKITPPGVVSTFAGSAGVSGTNNGTGSAARFYRPYGIATDRAGNIYVADSDNYTIRKITPAGVVTTLAGLAGNTGSADGTGSAARFSGPRAVAVDANDNIFVADYSANTVRKITAAGVVTTIGGIPSFSGNTDGLNGTSKFYNPSGIAVDNAGNVFVSNSGDNVIRKITPVGTNWLTSTIGGAPYFSGSADGAGSAARFNGSRGLATDSAGNIYVADTGNQTIRKGIFTAYAPTNPVVYMPPAMTGKLMVTLLPPEANGQWRFPWEQVWHNSGQVVSNLAQDNYSIQFRAVPGYLTIQTNFNVSVLNGQTTFITNQYLPTLNEGSNGTFGALTVNIGPNQLAGAGWRFFGEPGWRAADSTATNLLPDVYFIEFQPVSGRVKPASQSALIYPGLPTIISANYLLAQPAPNGVLLPFLVPTNNISNLNSYPFGFNGQLQSDIGYGSGVAVADKVVLTAAHLVFNDQTLSYVGQTYWYFQREAGTFEPQPQAARGWYVLSGYAAQRTNDLQSGLVVPDQSTPQSRNLDVAALYFSSLVAGGGYGGYLPSDATPNPWLTGSSLKMLVGYPVDGSQFGDVSIVPGKMYQTDPQPYPLSLATDPLANQQVYTATWFLSYPGNSGGPVYAQFNGYYYPAGVYVGTLFNGAQPYASAVRAIDSAVVNLITLAGTQGDSGTNNTGGGVITIIPNQAINAANPGYLQFQLNPPAAVRAGAGWKLSGDAAYSSATNYTRVVLSTNPFAVQFKPVGGWNVPSNQNVTVLPNQITTYSAAYTVTNPLLVGNMAVGLGITGTTGTVYRLERRPSLTSGSWLPVSTNTIASNGFNLLLPKPANFLIGRSGCRSLEKNSLQESAANCLAFMRLPIVKNVLTGKVFLMRVITIAFPVQGLLEKIMAGFAFGRPVFFRCVSMGAIE